MAVGRGRVSSIGLMSAAVLAFLAVSARAAQDVAADQPPIIKAFEVQGSNGYAIDVYSIELRRSERARLVVQVYDRDSISSYSTFTKKSKSWIRGDLGRFGHLAVRFHPDGNRWFKSRCSKPRLLAAGHFVGELEFHGESGYTDFPAQAVRVEPMYRFPDECASVGETIGRGPGVRLRVFSKFAQTTVVQNRPGGMVRVGVLTGGELDGVEVGKALEVVVPGGDFRWSPDLKRATLRPPAPFSGEAVYRRLGGHASRWSGNLKAEFPGWPPVRLTKGPSYTSFVHGSCHVEGLTPGGYPFDWCR